MLTNSLISKSCPEQRRNGRCLAEIPGMDEAWRVQQRLFPRNLPPAAGWEMATLCRPARLVGGDYLDLFTPAPGLVALAVGDVSGKGLGPALVMSHLHALVRGRFSARSWCLAETVSELNRCLLDVLPEDMFVTLFVGLLDTATGRLCYVNAGHPPAVLLSSPSGRTMRLSDGGPLLGILPGACFEAGEVMIPRGGLLAVFSDGLTEAHRSNGEMFREERVVNTLRQAQPWSAKASLRALVDTVEAFQEEAGQEDDLTLLVMSRS
jgi:serine phosphatase RsbU (regulator of sigma subunit)